MTEITNPFNTLFLSHAPPPTWRAFIAALPSDRSSLPFTDPSLDVGGRDVRLIRGEDFEYWQTGVFGELRTSGAAERTLSPLVLQGSENRL